jgi:hypothetical protein
MNDSSAENDSAGLEILKDLQTRFIMPFFFSRSKIHQATAALQAATREKRGQLQQIWLGPGDASLSKKHSTAAQTDSSSAPSSVQLSETSEKTHREDCVPPLYCDELLSHVRHFLFAAQGAGCAKYFRMTNQTANSLLQDVTVHELDHPDKVYPIRVAGPGIEIILSPQGVGLLVVGLALETKPIDRATALDFNQILARLYPKRQNGPADGDVGRFYSRAVFRRPAPGEKAELTPSQKQAIEDAQRPDAPVSARLGVRGGSFSLVELTQYLLEPLASIGWHFAQEEFSVYTVARFGTEMDLNRPEVQRSLGPFLAALAQVQESSHAGFAEDEQNLAQAVLNRRHWTAVGLLGTVHLLGDQPPPPGRDEHSFNEQRLPRVRDKYFIPFMIALLQRLTLNRASEEAGRALSVPEGQAAKRRRRLRQLRQNMARFGVRGNFTQLSSRQALHHYYKLARTGLDVPGNWEEVRQAISDLDADQMTRDVADNVEEITQVQKMVHRIEYFLIFVYTVELVSHVLPKERQPVFMVEREVDPEFTFRQHPIDFVMHHMSEEFPILIGFGLAAMALLWLAEKIWVHGHKEK